MTDDRFPRCRSESISASKADKVISPPLAISLSDFQNTSSRLTLVLRPPTSTDRFMIRDAITPPQAAALAFARASSRVITTSENIEASEAQTRTAQQASEILAYPRHSNQRSIRSSRQHLNANTVNEKGAFASQRWLRRTPVGNTRVYPDPALGPKLAV